jgi:hypothetical protein
MVYLPRTYGTAGTRVLVGQPGDAHAPNANQLASQFALVTLLREGGWDGQDDAAADDDDKMLRGSRAAAGTREARRSFGRDLERGQGGEGGKVFGNKDAAASSDWSLAKETREEDWTRPVLPAAVSGQRMLQGDGVDAQLQNFTSPIAPHVEERSGPVQVRVHVERVERQD